jgi:WD40 repeat protein
VPVPLSDRIVEVIADLGDGSAPRYRYGSGCIVRGRTVLTAAHVIAGAHVIQVRRSDKVLLPATADRNFIGGGKGPDLALIDIHESFIDLPAIELAVVNRDSHTAVPVNGCHAVGYPWFAETPSPSAVRDTVDAYGYIPVLSKLAGGLLTVQVTASPRPLPPERVALGQSEWSGMSGAPVIADGCLLGVVSEHAPREGSSAITAVPVTALEHDPAHPGWGPGVSNAHEWWARLGVSGPRALRRLPGPERRPEPSYWATVREIQGRTLHLKGRQRELAELMAFAIGPGDYQWLVGEPWAGKTALMAEAVTAARALPVDVVSYFLSRREADADSNRFLAAVVPQLAYLLDEDVPIPDLYRFRDLWHRAAVRAADTGRHLLLTVDGLDEDLHPPGLASVASILPAYTASNSHVIVTSRPHLEVDVPAGHPMRSTSPRLLDAFPGAEHLADLAQQEIYDLLGGDDQDLAADLLGVLTAAAGPLAIDDLAALTNDLVPPSPAWLRKVSRFVVERAARSLQPSGPPEGRRYQFAHASLLEQSQTASRLRVLRHSDYRRTIDRWADQWQEARWLVMAGDHNSIPRYLLDEYPSRLRNQPQRLAAFVGDIGWITAAIQAVGIDQVLAELATAQLAGAAPGKGAALLAILRAQAPNLRRPRLINRPSYLLRQLCLQALELGEDALAIDAQSRLETLSDARLMPIWTTRRVSRALAAELDSHDRDVAALAVLPDGRVVSGDARGRLLLWNPAAPAESPVELASGPGPAVTALATLPDGRIVSGSDELVKVWNPAAVGSVPITLGSHGGNKWTRAVLAVAALPDGRVISAGNDGYVGLWEPTAPGTAGVVVDHNPASVQALAVLADGRIVAGRLDGQVALWDLAAHGDPVVLRRSGPWVQTVAALPDGQIAAGGGDGRVWLWNPETDGGSTSVLGRDTGDSDDSPIEAITALPDSRVVSGDRTGRVRIWDPKTPLNSPVDLGRHDGRVSAVAVLPDSRIVSGGRDGRLRMWDPRTLGTYPVQFNRHDGGVRAVAVLRDGRVVSGHADGRVLVWRPEIRDEDPIELGRHHHFDGGGGLYSLAELPDGRVVAGGIDERVLVWDPNTPGADPVELGHHSYFVNAVAVLPDGRVVSGGGLGEGICVWDPKTPGADPIELGGHAGSMTGGVEVAVLPDGRVVSGGGDRRLLVWNPETPGTDPVELGRHQGDDPYIGGIDAVVVLRDGRVLSGADDRRLLIWDVLTPNGNPVELARLDGRLMALTALPDGRVVTSDNSRQLQVWDAARGTKLAQARCSVTAMAMVTTSATGVSLLTALTGYGLTIWSV